MVWNEFVSSRVFGGVLGRRRRGKSIEKSFFLLLRDSAQGNNQLTFQLSHFLLRFHFWFLLLFHMFFVSLCFPFLFSHELLLHVTS
jgi:hypothetical protein